MPKDIIKLENEERKHYLNIMQFYSHITRYELFASEITCAITNDLKTNTGGR